MRHNTYIMFSFEWSDKYQAYEYAFNCQTGQIADDHGELDGDESDFRYVVAIGGLTRLSDMEWDAVGNDIFEEADLVEIGKVLSKQAGFNAKNPFRKPPENGEAVFVWNWHGVMTESSANGPAEGWTETSYIGELSELEIKKPLYAQEDSALGLTPPKPVDDSDQLERRLGVDWL